MASYSWLDKQTAPERRKTNSPYSQIDQLLNLQSKFGNFTA